MSEIEADLSSQSLQRTGSGAASKEKKEINRLAYDGQAGQIFKIWILNILMSIITIGIYSFWGKTRMRKYLVHSFSLGKDRFEYTGTGGELFKGFLKAFPFIVILYLPFMIAEEGALWLLLTFIPIFYLYGVAIYGATRYRFSRTRWRGIRCMLGGSVFEYANLSALSSIMNVITLGFSIPYMDIAKHRYVMKHACFGTVRAQYKGDARNIYGAYIKSLLLFPLFMAPPILLFAIPIVIETMTETMQITATMSTFPGLLSALSYLFAIVLAVLFLPLARAIYTAALMREKMRGLIVEDLRFRCNVTAWKLIKHNLKNILITVFTLGFGHPIIVQRNMRFFAQHHFVIGDLETSSIFQAKDQGGGAGEGLEDALDIDAGIF